MTLYHRAADMLSRLHITHAERVAEVEPLIAELRAAAQQFALDELVRENERLGLYDDQKLAQLARDVYAIVYEQANDAGLWFRARTAPEAYLQQELRRLHAAIEAGPPAQQAGDVQPVLDAGWLQDCTLLYRLTDDAKPVNCDEIRVTMAYGTRDPEACSLRAAELLRSMQPLYASPPAQPRQPLSDDEIWASDEIMAANAECGLWMTQVLRFARAVERAHGIGAIKGEKS